MVFNLTINGKEISVEAPSNIRLSGLLKDYVGRKSVKVSCQSGQCGLCLVLVDYKPVYSCLYPGFKAINKKITTLEGITQKSEYQAIIKGFHLADVNLCPLCASARILVAYSYLRSHKNLKEFMVKNILESVSCNCTSKEPIREALYLSSNFISGSSL